MIADTRVMWLLSCCLWVGCANPTQQVHMKLVIEADNAVRAVVDDVTTQVEGRGSDQDGWQMHADLRFVPQGSHEWPLEFLLDVDVDSLYQLTATARDDRNAVVGQARVVRERAGAEELELRVLFDASCLRRSELCPNGETCRNGDCVDARSGLDDRELIQK